MNFSEIPRPLRQLVRARAKGRCEYCQTSEWLSGLPCEVDHIIPRAAGGLTTPENLCLACASCNKHKGSSTRAVDPESGAEATLYNPRQQKWSEHFAWSQDGTTVIGLTPCGRATITACQMNNRFIVAARSIWVGAGWHPPQH